MNLDISDPDNYVLEPPHLLFEQLRRSQPVYWQEMVGDQGYWAVLRYADVVRVARNPKLFSSSVAGSGLRNATPEHLQILRHQLTAMDPPQHARYREPLTDSFKRRAIGRLENRIRQVTQTIITDAAERVKAKGSVEFVHEVCSPLPTRIFGEMAGLPCEDWTYVARLAEKQLRSQDPDIAPPGEELKTAQELAAYCRQLAARHTSQPSGRDLTTIILESDFAGRRMTDIEFGRFFQQLIRAGNDTTVSLLSSGLLALLQHPNQLEELRSDPSLIPGAVDEMLRWASPVHLKRRTATADTELHGVRIKVGDKVAIYLISANRDEEVFSDPHRFDIHRSPNPHLAFGIGNHFCLGSQLTLLEGKIFFEELLAAFRTIELAGEPKRIRSNVMNGLNELPIVLA